MKHASKNEKVDLKTRSVRTDRTDRPHGPFLRTVRTDGLYGPSIRTVPTDRLYGPSVRTIRTDRTYGPSVPIPEGEFALENSATKSAVNFNTGVNRRRQILKVGYLSISGGE